MVVSAKILKEFLTDSMRTCAQARASVAQLTEQVAKGRPSPSQVRNIYRYVHTLKGSASMVRGAEEIVQSMHELEEQLGAQNASEAAIRASRWLPQAGEALNIVERVLTQMSHNQDELVEPALLGDPRLYKGFLVRAFVVGREMLLWFPLSSVIRVFTPSEYKGKQACELQGEWAPLLGTHRGESSVGLGFHSPSGPTVLIVDEVTSVTDWNNASRNGASLGIDTLFGQNPSFAQAA